MTDKASVAVGPGQAVERPESVNWINNVVRPKIRSFLTTKREVPDNLWVKCPESGQMVFYKDLEANQFVVPGSNYHMRMAVGRAPAAPLRRRPLHASCRCRRSRTIR